MGDTMSYEQPVSGYQRFVRGLFAIHGVALGVAISEWWVVGAVVVAVCVRALYDIHKEFPKEKTDDQR